MGTEWMWPHRKNTLEWKYDLPWKFETWTVFIQPWQKMHLYHESKSYFITFKQFIAAVEDWKYRHEFYIIGIFFGVAISLNIETIVPFIERIFNTEFLAKDIYLISAEQNIGLNKLREGILGEIMKDFSEDQVDILSSAWSERVWLYKNTKVISEKSCEDRLVFCVNWSIEQKQTFYKKFYQRINF